MKISSHGLSVIIATRNRANFLNQCLHNLISQLDSTDEIIVADNGSTDDTHILVKNLHKQYKNIKYLSISKIGASFARNSAFKHSSKEFVAFIDDDSFIQKDWAKNIKITLDNAPKNNETAMYQGCAVQKYSKAGFYEAIRTAEFNENCRLLGIGSKSIRGKIKYILACNVFALRKTWLKINGPFNQLDFPFIGEEVDLANRLLLNDIPIYYTPEVKVFHHKDSFKLNKYLSSAYHYGRAAARLNKIYLTNPEFLLKYYTDNIKNTQRSRWDMFSRLDSVKFNNKSQLIRARLFYILSSIFYNFGVKIETFNKN